MNADKIENGVRLAIVAVVGLAAGAASFTHVHDWTMHNSPAGTPDWFGWANAVISELAPIAALLTIRSNRRAGKSRSEQGHCSDLA
jgi:meiotically up-regulated gene 157 (Mug157) protein